jgi:hypothetical protein
MEECVICKKDIGETNSCVTECSHKYCLKCIIEHLKRNNNCPLCREKILDEALIQPESSDESSDESQSENADNQPEVIEIKSYEYYGKISLNNNLKILCVFTFIMVQTNIFLCIISLFK